MAKVQLRTEIKIFQKKRTCLLPFLRLGN